MAVSKWRFATVLAAALAALLPRPAAALTINFNPGPMVPQALAGFQMAASLWEAVLKDPVTVNLDIEFFDFGDPGILGGTDAYRNLYSYTSFKQRLALDQQSADDAMGVANLDPDDGFDLLMNLTRNGGYDPVTGLPPGLDGYMSLFFEPDLPQSQNFWNGLYTPHFDHYQGGGSPEDANNTTLSITRANAKALGLNVANPGAADAWIGFNSTFGGWYFDHDGGIGADQIDFVGVAAHEIGHALGFISGVDDLDLDNLATRFYSDLFGFPDYPGAPEWDRDYTYVSPMDMFRHSLEAGPGTIDWSVDFLFEYAEILGDLSPAAANLIDPTLLGLRDKYFSLDGGANPVEVPITWSDPFEGIGYNPIPAWFSGGMIWGDGHQASHWADEVDPFFGYGLGDPLGMMDPVAPTGEVMDFTALDIQIMDAIGWDLQVGGTPPPPSPAVPEPTTLLWLACGGCWLRRRKQAGR